MFVPNSVLHQSFNTKTLSFFSSDVKGLWNHRAILYIIVSKVLWRCSSLDCRLMIKLELAQTFATQLSLHQVQ